METNFLNILQREKLSEGFSQKNIVRILRGGAPYFTRLQELIEGAGHSILIQVYIFADDTTGNRIAKALMAAAERGVAVYLLADGYASRGLPKEFIHRMENAGIHFRFFEPLFRGDDFYFGRRLHHKVMVVDARYALVSGSNIADRYNDLPQQEAWFDMALFVEGDSVLELYDICIKIWERDKTRKNVLRKNLQDIFQYIADDDTADVKVLQNDWVRRKLEIYFAYQQLFKRAQKSITIVCSYFLPGLSLRRRLAKAVKRGVRVKVVLANVSDVALTKDAERYLYRWMLRNGIEIYEYLPNILHAKMAVVDDDLLTIGSYNINDLSAKASVELNLLVNNRELARELKTEVDNMIAGKCLHITASSNSLRLWSFRQLWQFICYHALRFLLTIGTFYFKQKE